MWIFLLFSGLKTGGYDGYRLTLNPSILKRNIKRRRKVPVQIRELTDKMVVDDRITNDPDRLIGGSFRQVNRRTCPALRSRRRGGFFLAALVVLVVFLDVTGASLLGPAMLALPSSSIDAYQPLREKESKSLTSSCSMVRSRNKKVNKHRHIRSHYRPGVENNKHAHAWRHRLVRCRKEKSRLDGFLKLESTAVYFFIRHDKSELSRFEITFRKRRRKKFLTIGSFYEIWAFHFLFLFRCLIDLLAPR